MSFNPRVDLTLVVFYKFFRTRNQASAKWEKFLHNHQKCKSQNVLKLAICNFGTLCIIESSMQLLRSRFCKKIPIKSSATQLYFRFTRWLNIKMILLPMFTKQVKIICFINTDLFCVCFTRILRIQNYFRNLATLHIAHKQFFRTSY